MTEEFAKKMTLIYGKFEELKVKISNLRKDDKDPIIADLLLRNIKSKILYAEITRDQNDLIKIERTIEEIEKELTEVNETKEENIRDEIKQMLAKER